MDKKKKIIIIAAAVAAVAAIAVAATQMGDKKLKKADETQNTQALDSAQNDNTEQDASQTADNNSANGEQKSAGDSSSKTENSKNENKNADGKKSEEKASDNMTKGEKEELAGYTKNLPTFMYFISSKDAGYADEKATVEKLKGEYDGRVTFMVKEVDDSEDTYKELLGAMETPALVMLDKDGNSTAILPGASDYNALKSEIEKTLK